MASNPTLKILLLRNANVDIEPTLATATAGRAKAETVVLRMHLDQRQVLLEHVFAVLDLGSSRLTFQLQHVELLYGKQTQTSFQEDRL